MPTIRISEQNWRRLQKWAIPLEDTADSALTKVLDAAEGSSSHEEGKPTQSYVKGDKKEQIDELHHWLTSIPGVSREKVGKTMDTYLLGHLPGGKARRLFVSKSGLLYLPRLERGGYGAADPQQRVVYKDIGDPPVGWNYYPQFTVEKKDDVEYAKRLILLAIDEFER